MDRFNSGHLIFIILGVSIVSMKTYPKVFLENGLRDSWIAVIISSILIFFFYLFIIKVWKNSEEKSFVRIYKYTLGKKLGNVFIFLFILTLFMTLIECASVEIDSMHQNMLLSTPKWFFLIFLVIPAMFVVSKHIVAISIVAIIGIILIMIAGINLGILTSGYKDIRMLTPIFEDGITWNFIISIIETLGLYGFVSISLPYLSNVEDKRNKITRDSIIALIILVQMEIVSTSGILMTFTPARAISMNYPKLLQTQMVSYFQFLDFGELYVMLQIVGGWLLKYILTFYAILIILRDYKIGKKTERFLVYIISIIVFIASIFVSRNSFKMFELLNVFQYISLFNFVIIPFIVFSILGVKNLKEKVNNSSS
ncbi:endospore germination permease [Tissierella sp. Yu-01]|uniref:GerAB/ArcD/ProY family transporter n=1 Tax=Tissierella sp. Yu-01 TaxID=3035694 RepID=UPI00240D8757|nr:endospore germination permease [Tissierella sp. Yu-01]WFA09341.1 endospore germination permease [Tissierella sp. Yu-01]